METDRVKNIIQNPKFQQLVQKKSRLSWSLSIIMLFIYFGYIYLVSYHPAFVHQSLDGGATTIGIPLGIAVIVSAFVLCGIYVWRANGEFDRLTQEVLEEIKK
ncbi:DUF485 domain-containing protein [Aquirhabdus parva]|uniref:DUF485 domain-containing protein n=1 Tax=Aquirhabdus parva TaxID=2283318 RepID=A0A345P2W9_9GAMM|nr:DUF485 domain-containing protein [Aquirhabdus parva]AXI01628.1 DUF485 domain-containing protein [Aquirhabdus parva]